MATNLPHEHTDVQVVTEGGSQGAQLKGYNRLSTNNDPLPTQTTSRSTNQPPMATTSTDVDNPAFQNEQESEIPSFTTSELDTTSVTELVPNEAQPPPTTHKPYQQRPLTHTAPTQQNHVGFTIDTDHELNTTEEGDETDDVRAADTPTTDTGRGYQFIITESDTQLYSAEECFNHSKRIIKVIFAFCLFCVILGCILVSKGSVLFIASQMNKYVSFKRRGFYNETWNASAVKVGTTLSFMYANEHENNVTTFPVPEEPVDCSGGPRGQCEQCGVPVCLAEHDKQCAEKETVRWIWSMFLCQCVPYFIMFLRCLWKISFKKKKAPGYITFIAVMVVESFYTVGIYLLLYVLLPQLDATRGLFLFTGTAFLPSLLKILNRPETKGMSRMKNIFLDVLAFLGQTCALVTWLVLRTYNDITLANGKTDMNAVCENVNYQPPPTTTESYTTVTNMTTTTTLPIVTTGIQTTPEPPLPPISYEYVQMGQLPEDMNDFKLVPLTLFLISLGFWQNFVDKATHYCGFLNKFRNDHAHSSTKIYIWISLWKILLTFVLLVFHHWLYDGPMSLNMIFDSKHFYDNKCGQYDYYYDSKENVDDRGNFQSDWIEVAVVQISMGVLCFYAADMAIKGQMQEISFTTPLVIATPSAFFLLYWACVDCFSEWDFGTSYYWNCFSGENNYEEYMANRYVLVGFIWWLSFVVLTRYLWFPQKLERLAKLDRAFVYPVPEGTMLDQALSLIRRRNDEETFDNVDKKKDRETDVDDQEPANEIPTTSSADGETPLKEGYVPTMKDDKHDTPFIYMCATMWHETENDMKQMLSSLFRVNADQCLREKAKTVFNLQSNDYYRFEAHIFFDDAFESHNPWAKTGYKVNSFVKDFINTINRAASSVMNHAYVMDTPTRFETPYGGRLEWKLPFGNNKLVLHLKDRQLIRIRKRWSQIMYMHRILGMGIMDQPRSQHVKKVVSENTFILALDGSINFKADAVLLLLDLMKRNKKVAAASGRIHPIGNGPMVWYQKFEYSISHWLQKATEHVLGCVLCSPGCFSLLRCSALMDENVVEMFSTMATKPIHYVQYNQGEDRWLCTLLLKQGYKIEYSAAADAYTTAPEGFNEFFHQRRRWITSTFANLLDFLKSGRAIATKNENISTIYIVYQGLLFAVSVLGPATIFMLIVGAFETAFGIDPLVSFFVGLVPLAIFMIVCFKAKTDTQLYYAALLSVIFVILQILVIVGISQRMVKEGICAPSTIFFLFVFLSFILCAFLHPQEFFSICHVFLYYLFIPSIYLLLIVYSLCNLHVISWGTREIKPTPSDNENEQVENNNHSSNKLIQALMKFTSRFKFSGGFSIDFSPCCLLKCCSHGEERQLGVSEQMQVVEQTQEHNAQDEGHGDIPPQSQRESSSHIVGNLETEMEHESWIDDLDILRCEGSKGELHPDETKFWKCLIEDYLYPIETSMFEVEKIKQGLLDLRNKAVFSFFLIDIILMVLVLALTKSNLAISWECTVGGEVKSSKLDPIGFTFVFTFGAVLAIQVVGMLIHRLFTFMQIMAKTVICSRKGEHSADGMLANAEEVTPTVDEFSEGQILNLVRQLQRFDIEPDEDTQTEVDESEDAFRMQLGDDIDDDIFNRHADHNAVRKISYKPTILTNEEIDKKLAARYVALSDEVFGRPSGFDNPESSGTPSRSLNEED